jgi:hypothetical protein
MSHSLELKTSIHSLVDKSNDNELLEIVHQLLESKTQHKEGTLINKLSQSEEKELYEAYDESFDESNLILFSAPLN